MKYLLILLLLFVTSKLTYSQNNIVVKYTCDPNNTDLLNLRERIIKKEILEDSIIIVLGKRDICCATFSANYTLINDTLKINYENIGESCFCPCYYELTFTIPNNNIYFSEVTFNGQSYTQTNKKFSEFTKDVDTLNNGTILIKEYENGELILEFERQDTLINYRRYYKGELIQEYKSKNRL